MKRRKLPSPSMVVAVIALIVAMSGTGYAAATLATNSVGAKQLKKSAVTSSKMAKNAITSAKVKDGSLLSQDFKAGQLKAGATGPQGPQGVKGEQGSIGPAGPGARWALVNKAHTAILAQSGGITITTVSGAGTYLDMGADVDGKVIQATNAYTDDDAGLKGSLIAVICGGGQYAGGCGAPGTNDTRHVWVFTQNQANTAGENHAFYVAVF
jgi:hypothetical protein